MYGEKAEEAEELKMDLEDVKMMYRAQVWTYYHSHSIQASVGTPHEYEFLSNGHWYVRCCTIKSKVFTFSTFYFQIDQLLATR